MSTPLGLSYNQFVISLAALAVVEVTTTAGIVVGVDDWFNTLIPLSISYAEQRIVRDLDMNATLNSENYTLLSGTNKLTVPLTDFFTVESIQATVGGVPMPVNIASKEYIQTLWGDPTATAAPIDFAIYGGDAATQGETDMLFLFGPYADQDYPLLVTGRQRAASLYANATDPTKAATVMTFISQWLPDLMLQASMIIVAQFQRNFGQASNDPQMGPSYEAQYEMLLKGALTEEARKKWQASAWSSSSSPLLATPSR